MSSSDLVLSSARSGALSPLNLGIAAIIGPQYTSGTSFGADLVSRLLFMIFERIIRGIESLARSYLDKFAETRAKMGEEKAKVLDEMKAAQEIGDSSKVTQAINGKHTLDCEGMHGSHCSEHHTRFGAPFSPGCPTNYGHGPPFEPPFFVKFFLGRRQKWLDWREQRMIS